MLSIIATSVKMYASPKWSKQQFSVIIMIIINLILQLHQYIKNCNLKTRHGCHFFFASKFNLDWVFFYLTQNWSFMRQLCNRGPLLKKMQEFQCEDVELASAKRARTLLSSYNRETIIKISVAIVNLFNWVSTQSKDSKFS